MVTIEMDGAEPDAERLWEIVTGYGHFTAMQVRNGRTRGLALHMERLDAANRETFGVGIDPERVQNLIRHALGDTADASVRVYLYEGIDRPATIVTVRPPGEVTSPQRLRSVRYQRPNAHIKHVTTDQGHYRRRAQGEGFDDALLTDEGGRISETTMANIGFFDEAGVVWPDARMLRGITMQLLERALPASGMSSRYAPVHLRDIASFDGAFLTNARGIAAITQIDEVGIDVSRRRTDALIEAYASVPWDSL
jgi:branched-subunit amino acid aminotransferase/4-amino-4-deoxychorismate lyase